MNASDTRIHGEGQESWIHRCAPEHIYHNCNVQGQSIQLHQLDQCLQIVYQVLCDMHVVHITSLPVRSWFFFGFLGIQLYHSADTGHLFLGDGWLTLYLWCCTLDCFGMTHMRMSQGFSNQFEDTIQAARANWNFKSSRHPIRFEHDRFYFLNQGAGTENWLCRKNCAGLVRHLAHGCVKLISKVLPLDISSSYFPSL